jgi:hypothetical protein
VPEAARSRWMLLVSSVSTVSLLFQPPIPLLHLSYLMDGEVGVVGIGQSLTQVGRWGKRFRFWLVGDEEKRGGDRQQNLINIKSAMKYGSTELAICNHIGKS